MLFCFADTVQACQLVKCNTAGDMLDFCGRKYKHCVKSVNPSAPALF